MGVVGRSPKYYFLVFRLKDDAMYCAATIARLLERRDLQRHGLGPSLKEARFKARQSLARIARKSGKPYEGLVRLPGPGPRNVYPGLRGAIWKQLVQDRQSRATRVQKKSLRFSHGA